MNDPHVPDARAATTPPGRRLLCGLIGSGIQYSLTPALQEAEARAQGLALHYQLIDLDCSPQGAAALPWLLDAARVMGFAGLNITYPCKQAVIPLLDGLSNEAEAMGAVNTVVLHGGRAVGHNTDGSGWARGLQQQLPGADLGCVALLGSGGAGAAIAHTVLRLGARALRLVDVVPARAQALAERLNALYLGQRASAAPDAAAALQGATGLAHATPMGMTQLPGLPLDAALLHRDLWVAEAVYFPLETALLKAARAAGCRVCDGGGMAVGQAIGAFELFTGQSADGARMDAHFRRLIARRGQD